MSRIVDEEEEAFTKQPGPVGYTAEAIITWRHAGATMGG